MGRLFCIAKDIDHNTPFVNNYFAVQKNYFALQNRELMWQYGGTNT